MAQQAHERYQTEFTKSGKLNMKNRKPFRTAEQKREARLKAVKSDDGAFRSTALVSYHK